MNAKQIRRNYLRVLLGCCGAAALLVSASGLTTHADGRAVEQSSQQAASQDASSQAAKPSLAGSWKLNKDQSDDPRQKMQQAMGNAGGGQGEGGNPNRAEGRPGRGGGGMMAEWTQLAVTQLDANVKVTGSSGRTLANTAPPDDSAKSNDDSSGGSANDNSNGERRRMGPPAQAQWQGSQLVVKGQGFGGGSTTRTFELSPDGKQLYVTTKITNERLSQPVTYRLVYDKGSATNNSQ